jgi:hypothetical protein
MGRLLAAVAVLALAMFAVGSAGGEDLPRLVGTVGPGFTIDLADASGKHVDQIPAGRYELLVHDLSEMHNFVLGSKSTGERYIDTGVEFVGDKTVTVDLAVGRYGYACSPHFEVMNGSLTVFRATPPVVTKPLRATVGANVTLSAKRVGAGRYRLTVVDRSKSRNFHLVGFGVNRKTGKAFKGTVAWTIDLAPGTYRFGSDPKLTGRLVVT